MKEKEKNVKLHLTPEPGEDVRTGLSPSSISKAILDNLYFIQGRLPATATRNEWYMALAYAVRDRMLEGWIKSVAFLRKHPRIVSYLSAEFLPGPHLENAMINLGIREQVSEAVKQLGIDVNDLIAQEQEPGLGNGGLGRLAACFLDSLASLEIPAIGYGIRYEFGIFDQEIQDGWQSETTDRWLAMGNPWEIVHPEIAYYVGFGGSTTEYTDEEGGFRVHWEPARIVKGVAYDTPIPGYRTPTNSLLRLWKSEACKAFDIQAFNMGDYYGAVEDKVISETISKVLYPNDEPAIGKRLRLAQQYFFVSCSLQDMLHVHKAEGGHVDTFHEKFAIQLNDTHPSIAVAELMRLFLDEHLMGWEQAWTITKKTFSFTNHTLLPEAFEKWPIDLFKETLPRHLTIIFEINRRFLEEVEAQYPGDVDRLRRLSIIDETGTRYVRMAHLATVGSHRVNGVALLHTKLLKDTAMRDFHELWPKKFINVTNGVTPRRWMALSNPALTNLITKAIGDGWIGKKPDQLVRLEELVDDGEFRRAWHGVKYRNKISLAHLIKMRTGLIVNPETLFDIQAKRIHEYKRQHLNILHVIALYLMLKREPAQLFAPRTMIFGGKAAPGYFMAKLIIKLITSVAEVINNDTQVKDRLKVVFLPDFNVTNGQRIYPAADLSEQISTAGKEASGTGNMKFSMNGALTIGTLDGANVEIRQRVGEDNFFLFGLGCDDVAKLKKGTYNPRQIYEENGQLKEVLDLIGSGFFSKGDKALFAPLVASLLDRDEYLVLADYSSYVKCQKRVNRTYIDEERWVRMSILNVARMGYFSSDRSIKEYADEIWHVKPVVKDVKGRKTRLV